MKNANVKFLGIVIACIVIIVFLWQWMPVSIFPQAAAIAGIIAAIIYTVVRLTNKADNPGTAIKKTISRTLMVSIILIVICIGIIFYLVNSILPGIS